MDYEPPPPPAPEQPDAIKTLFTYHPPAIRKVREAVMTANASIATANAAAQYR